MVVTRTNSNNFDNNNNNYCNNNNNLASHQPTYTLSMRVSAGFLGSKLQNIKCFVAFATLRRCDTLHAETLNAFVYKQQTLVWANARMMRLTGWLIGTPIAAASVAITSPRVPHCADTQLTDMSHSTCLLANRHLTMRC
ncbi:unnamed protein product [Ceratitis capitata]|uniref:(Mediterranean fruit fly) hypothetical protein n=1 Tax=Ceratitis capitata TaxID=7213 RepID=A0A811U939_CERCA|nr:unnamed protein product [Ceratitis capitata]